MAIRSVTYWVVGSMVLRWLFGALHLYWLHRYVGDSKLSEVGPLLVALSWLPLLIGLSITHKRTRSEPVLLGMVGAILVFDIAVMLTGLLGEPNLPHPMVAVQLGRTWLEVSLLQFGLASFVFASVLSATSHGRVNRWLVFWGVTLSVIGWPLAWRLTARAELQAGAFIVVVVVTGLVWSLGARSWLNSRHASSESSARGSVLGARAEGGDVR